MIHESLQCYLCIFEARKQTQEQTAVVRNEAQHVSGITRNSRVDRKAAVVEVSEFDAQHIPQRAHFMLYHDGTDAELEPGFHIGIDYMKACL